MATEQPPAAAGGDHVAADGPLAAEPAAPLAVGDAAAQQPGAAHQAAAPPQMPSQRMLLPSPFESTAGLPPLAVGAPAGADAAVANGRRRSPKGLAPSKSALKVRYDASLEPQGSKTMKQALSWADTHGKNIQHVHEYQPSEHGDEGVSKGCQCCVQ